MSVYYNRLTPNQMRGVVTRPVAGLDEYNPSVSINDNNLSSCLDVMSYRSQSMSFNSNATMTAGVFATKANLDGIIYEAIAIQGGMVANVSDNGYGLLVFKKDTTAWYFRHAKDKATIVVDSYALSGYGLPTTNIDTYNFSSCNFNTEANTYVCFSCEYVKQLIYFDFAGAAVGKIELPFYPKKIVAHVNRIFAIDTANKLWWCRAGDLFSWYSMEYDDDRLLASTDMKATAFTTFNAIDVPRPVTLKITKVDTLDTLGSAVLVGTNVLNAPLTATKTLVEGRVQTLESFKTLTSITCASWITAGAADKLEVGVAPVSGGYVQADSGYWTVEREKSLTDLCVISNNLYIFAPENIYIFKGYDYDTFSLTLIISNMGIKENATPRRWLAVSNNIAYFYNNGDIYEFNGYDVPRIISHSIFLNGNITNGIMGGIETVPVTHSLVADDDFVYVYNSVSATYTSNPYYMFNKDERTWWIMSGFTTVNSVYTTGTVFKVQYIPMISSDAIVSFVSVDSTAGSFDMHYLIGHRGSVLPFIVTKAFNTNPSELGTLTSLILQVEGTATETANIKLYYSVTADTSDFTLFKTFTAYAFTGDVQIIEIPLPTNIVPNNHHYRIKLEIEPLATHGVMLYNIERRFRIRGRSR